MDDNVIISRFPSCFPIDFEEKLLPKDLPEIELAPVYRVCITGEISKSTFLSTYEEDLINPSRKQHPLDDPGTFGTSLSISPNRLKNILKCLTRYYPEPYIIIGKVLSFLGPAQKTYERTHSKKDKDHVDWWLYTDSDPSYLFKKYEPEAEIKDK